MSGGPFTDFLTPRLQSALVEEVPLRVSVRGVEVPIRRTLDGAEGSAHGLHVKVRMTRPDEGPCVAWTTTVTNTGTSVVDGIQIEPVRMTFELEAGDLPRVRHLSGSWHYDALYPPRAFRLHDEAFVTHDHARPVTIGGSNASEHSPLLQVGLGAPLAEAVFVALEWSGGWQLEAGWAESSFTGGPRPAFSVAGKAELGPLSLEPGASLAAPAVHLGGDRVADWRELDRIQRRHLRDLMPASALPELPVSYDSWFGRYDQYDLDTLLADASAAAELGVEVFCLDAGWYRADGWFDGIGNWRTPHPGRFPRGERDIVALAEHVRSLGMTFGLWHLIQVAMPGTDAVVERPDLYRVADDAAARAGAQPGQAAAQSSAPTPLLLALERPEAVDYALEILEGWIERWGVGWFRFESTPGDGLAYNEGYNRMLDELRRRHPGLYIEECNGGGQRLDVNSVRRTHGTWLSDHTTSPEVTRFHQTGAARFWPSRMLNMAVTAFAGAGDPADVRYEVLSRMAGVLSFDGAVSEWSAAARADARMGVEAYKSIRHLVDAEAWFPLAQPRTVDDWDAIVYSDPASREAVLLVFRMAGRSEQEIEIPGLALDAVAELVFASDAGATVRVGDGGVRVGLAPRSAAIWRFRLS